MLSFETVNGNCRHRSQYAVVKDVSFLLLSVSMRDQELCYCRRVLKRDKLAMEGGYSSSLVVL